MDNLVDQTIVDFDEGDIVNGTIVKIGADEVLLDIGYKSEGVIPVRELSIRKDADPSQIVALGDPVVRYTNPYHGELPRTAATPMAAVA